MTEPRALAPRPVRRSPDGRAYGHVLVHSAPRPLVRHVEWALARVLGAEVDVQWYGQPIAPGMVRTELSWRGRPGTVAAVVSALRTWDRLRVEATEHDPSGTGERFALTPRLGIFRASIDAHGQTQVGEHALRAAIVASDGDPYRLEDELDRLLGTAWDEELEPFRAAAEGLPLGRIVSVS